jgi:N-acetylmuramoyl-L-alanine amidase
MLEKDPAANKPYRLYIDFDKSRLGEGIKKFIPINDNLLIDARASQYQSDLVRVVVDIKSFGTYKIFPIRNPFRTIIDVWGGDDSQKYTKKAEEKLAEIKLPKDEPEPKNVVPEKTPSRTKPTDIAKSLALGVRRIVIDPGHGGKDAGAVGYHKNVLEKNIVLSIGKRLARRIRQELGCEVIMTRTTDRFIGLEERTAIANTKNADLFISIHTNAHTNRRAYGIETYFLNLATDDDAIRVAARENATSRKNISDLEKILNDLMQNAKINESSRLAAHVQKSLYEGMKRRYGNIKNKGVKQAPFYVLLGAQMPSILVETSFISHKRECERLNNPVYQEHLCDAIVSGIRKYIEETNPTALRRPQRNLGMRD